MAENRKALVIQTKDVTTPGKSHQWNELQQVQNFIQKISTPSIQTDGEDVDINSLISGIPTPWARAMMFRYAIEYSTVPDEQASGLFEFFGSLRNEWKGLLACIALDSSHISIEKIDLSYFDADNGFELKGGLGQMLFEDKNIWSEPEAVQKTPYIQLIRYKGKVVGGTSPYSLLFTAPNYAIEPEKIQFYKGGKFVNPLHYLRQEELQKLYSYVEYVRNQLVGFQKQFEAADQNKISITALQTFLNDWLKEMANHAHDKRWELKQDDKLKINFKKFVAAPFDKVFNVEYKIYYQGLVFFDDNSGNAQAEEVDLQNLLLPDTETSMVRIEFAPNENPADCGVYLLKADGSDGKFHYFAVPLSDTGVVIFQNGLSKLLSYEEKDGLEHHISAFYDMENNWVKLSLKVKVGNHYEEIERLYKNPVNVPAFRKKVMVFPDFVAPAWKKYYLYSEIPHNDDSDRVKVLPLLADENFKLQIQKANKNQDPNAKDRLQYIVEKGKTKANLSETKLLVHYDFNKLGATNLKYEVYESEFPFRGLEIRVLQDNALDEIAGYLLVKDIMRSETGSFTNLNTHKSVTDLQEANVGFDFGSNNTCISFSMGVNQPQLVKFKNRRRFLIGNDTIRTGQQEARPALPNELLFFQNEEPSGQVKSMITVHDEKRLNNATLAVQEPVSGGLPVFESNLSIEDFSKHDRYTVKFGNDHAHIYYNMKWTGNEHKKAFLKTLWLKTNAELFAEHKARPTQLLWAYPSAMSRGQVADYRIIWNSVAQVQPILQNQTRLAPEMTESEAVCKFAITVGGIAVGKRSMFIGYDVGGSTTDILMVAQDPVTFENKFIKQSSVLAAAYAMAKAAQQSPKLQQIIQKFSVLQGLQVFNIDKIDNHSAAYYLNVIFDRLNNQQLSSFYQEFYSAGCKEVFAVSAYVSGLLLYYSGQLAARVLQDEAYKDVNMIQMGFYGKGGRIFDWLREVMGQDALDYYKNCFYAGIGEDFKNISIDINNAFGEHNKLEVAYGLSSTRNIAIGGQMGEIIGEDGYMLGDTPLNALDEINHSHLEQFNKSFTPPREFRRLGQLLSIYFDFIEKYSLIPNTQEIKQGQQNLLNRFTFYVENHPQFREAQAKGNNFDFVSPMIMLEGMALFDEVILPSLFR